MHFVGLTVFHQAVAQVVKRLIVAGAQRRKGHLLIARVFQGFHTVLQQQIFAAVTHRAVNISRLATTAATDAAAEQLQCHTVIDHLCRRHNRSRREIGFVHILHDALGNHPRRTIPGFDGSDSSVSMIGNIVKAWNIHAFDLRCRTQKTGLLPSFVLGPAVQFDDFHRHILALA